MINSDFSLSVSYNYSDYVKYEIRTKTQEESDLYVKGLNYLSKINKMSEHKNLINKDKIHKSSQHKSPNKTPNKSPIKINIK